MDSGMAFLADEVRNVLLSDRNEGGHLIVVIAIRINPLAIVNNSHVYECMQQFITSQ